MIEVDAAMIEQYLPHIHLLDVAQKVSRNNLLIPDFRLYQKDNLEIYYAPFDYIKPNAKLLIVGITPGWTQMEIAYRVFKIGLTQNKSRLEIYSDIEQTASFAGSMRTNLISMLEDLKISNYLEGVPCESLFSKNHHLIHTTSVIRYPVFINTKNYTGHSPKILKNTKLKEFVDIKFSQELSLVREALIIPQGKAVSEVLKYLIDQGKICKERCLLDFPHASGANGHRKKFFEQFRDRMKKQVKEWFQGYSL